jgi:hypothetical protein
MTTLIPKYYQGSTGSANRPINLKLQDWVHVKDFGAVGDGSTDDTTAIQNALNASSAVYFGGPNNSYKITAALTVNANQVIFAEFAKVQQYTNNTQMFNIGSNSNVTITGINAVGVGTDFIDSDSSLAVGVYTTGTTATNIFVFNNKFTNFSYTAVRFVGVTNGFANNNIIVGPGSSVLTPGTSYRCYGLLADTACSIINFSQNQISKTAQGITLNYASNVIVDGNQVNNIISQHGIYCGNNSYNIILSNNIINSPYYIGIKCQTSDTSATSNNQNITIVDNVINNAGDQGIFVGNADGATSRTKKVENITITGNSVRYSGGYNININNASNCVVSSNVLENSSQGGIILQSSAYVTIEGNHVLNAFWSGILDGYSNTNVNVTNNKIVDCAVATLAGNTYGIFFQGGSNLSFNNNTITDANAKMTNGIYLAGGTQNTISIYDNFIYSSTSTAINFAATGALLKYSGNYLNGTSGAATGYTVLPSVASASTITLSTAQDVFSITGTTTITSIAVAGHSGHRITLVFVGACTVTNGGTLALAGATNFVSTSSDTLTLVCDGVIWYEAGRSVN